MNKKIQSAIDNYVSLLPDLYSSPNDHSRLVEIAYEVEICNESIGDEFKQYFHDALSKRFNNYAEKTVQEFYLKRIKQIENYSYPISVLKTDELLKNN